MSKKKKPVSKKPISKKPTKKPEIKQVAKSRKPKSKNVGVINKDTVESIKFWQEFEKDLFRPAKAISNTSPHNIVIPMNSGQSVKVAIPTAILDFLDEQPSKPSKSWIGKWCEQMQIASLEVFEYLLKHPLIAGIVISVITFTVAMAIVGLLG